nr:hypothetical protein [Maliibacterium massiliense]
MKKRFAAILALALIACVLAGCSKLPGDVPTPSDYKYKVGAFTVNDVKIYDTKRDCAVGFGMNRGDVETIYGAGKVLISHEGVDIVEYPQDDNLRLYFRDGRVARIVVNDLYGDRFKTFRGIGTTSTPDDLRKAYGPETSSDANSNILTYRFTIYGRYAGQMSYLYDYESQSGSFMIGDDGDDLGAAINAYTSLPSEPADDGDTEGGAGTAPSPSASPSPSQSAAPSPSASASPAA